MNSEKDMYILEKQEEGQSCGCFLMEISVSKTGGKLARAQHAPAYLDRRKHMAVLLFSFLNLDLS